jgi:COMPASS component SPP1
VKTAARHGKLAGIKKAANNSLVASRSRSTSVMPAGSVDNEAEEKDDDEKEEPADDKLYCVCETKYDEDRFMIACDRFVIS